MPLATKIVTDTNAVGSMTGSGSSYSWSHTISKGYNPYLLVGSTTYSATGSNTVISGITINGIALTKILRQTVAGQATKTGKTISTELWYLPATSLPPAGTYTITVTFAGSCDVATGASLTLFNVNPTAPEANASNTLTSGGGGRTLTTNITTLTANAMLVDVMGSQDSSSYSMGSGQTQDGNSSVNPTGPAQGMSHKLTTSAGANSMAQTNSNGEALSQIAVSLAYKAPQFFGGMI